MNRAWLLFLLPLVLFAGWLAYLGWMVQGRPLVAPGFPLVVSRPQVLESPIDVVVELEDSKGKAKVVEILYPAKGAALKEGDEIEVARLDECHPLSFVKNVVPPDDYDGPGRYLVPLRPVDGAKGRYEVSPVPRSPGFRPDERNPVVRIYRDSAEVRAQYAQIKKP